MKFAWLNLRVDVSGDGRRDVLEVYPITPSAFATTSPPASLTQSSPGFFSEVVMTAGNNNIVQAGSLNNLGFSPKYVIVVPPSTSVNGKTMKGAAADTGVSLKPGYPLVLAIAGVNLATWGLVINSVGTESVDLWII